MKTLKILFFVSIGFILNSCFVEQRIAYSYQSELHTTPILFQNSAEVYIINSKGNFPYNVSPEVLNYNYDSSFLASDLVKHIDIYDYKEDFAKYLVRNLNSHDLNIYTADSIVSFIKNNDTRMIVDVIQLEIEEYYDVFYDEINDMPSYFNTTNKYLHIKDAELHTEKNGNFTNYYSTIEIPRNAIIVNLWLQIDLWVEDSVHKSSTVFMDYVLSDDIEGKFIMKDLKNPKYLYTIDSLNTNDLWKVSELPTSKFADNIVDYLVNNIVDLRYFIKQNKYPKYNWKYKKKSGLIIPYEEELPYLILHEEE